MRFIAKLLSAVIPLSIMISAPVQARDWASIEKSGKIIAATEGAFAPFNYYEGTKLTGYEVDVAEALASQARHEARMARRSLRLATGRRPPGPL
jgi:polar amino acid transport system substrate-binding protein